MYVDYGDYWYGGYAYDYMINAYAYGEENAWLAGYVDYGVPLNFVTEVSYNLTEFFDGEWAEEMMYEYYNMDSHATE